MSVMGIKAVGAVTVILCTWLLSGRIGARRKAAMLQIESFLVLFDAIRSGILRYIPLSEVLESLPDEVIEQCMGRMGARGADPTAFFNGCIWLSEELDVLMARAAKELGHGYREEQLAVCDRYREALLSLREKSEKREKEGRTLLTPLMMAGASGVVLLLL